MTQVRLRNIIKRFGSAAAVAGVSLDIASGEFVCLLGASGCGKTTLLRILGGFTQPDSGDILIDGKRVDMLPPSRRRVGFVFQSYALFPTKTVAENIGFGLAIRRRPKAEIARRVAELCALTRLSGMEGRYPHEMSGGQQQRVALARALAPEPSLLLLDEPLSALDAKIRVHLRTEIRSIVDRLKITTVYVTHDQEEALSIADRVAVMEAGQILQIDSPIDIYLRPTQRFVADFVGSNNALQGTPTGPNSVEVSGLSVNTLVPEGLRADTSVLVCIRPEDVVLTPVDKIPSGGIGTLESITFAGSTVRVRLNVLGGNELLADIPTHEWQRLGFSRGNEVSWHVRAGTSILLPASG